MRMSKAFFGIYILLCMGSYSVRADEPVLMTGDIIFQTSNSNQSYAIMWATKSLYSHVGVIEISGNKKFVIEAISRVSRTPLDKWIKRGRLARYAVYRYGQLNSDQREAVISNAKALLGRKYDIYFTSMNNEIYCSELVDIAYKKAGFTVGKMEKVKDLDVDNILVRRLVEKRWRKHPVCKNGVRTFDECWIRVLDDELISPENLSKDPHLKKIWTNYP